MHKVEFLEPPRPVPVRRNYLFWGFVAGAMSGVLVGHPLFKVIYVFHEYLYQQGTLSFSRAIFDSFSFHSWPLTLFFAISGAFFGSLLGWVYGLLKENRLYQEMLRKEFEIQVASLRHHYKNLTIGIRGFSRRIRSKLNNLDEVLEGICAKRGDCPGFQEYSQEFQDLKRNIITLDNSAENLETMLAKELQFLRALATDCMVPVPQDLYSVLLSSIQILLELRFYEKEIQVEINGRPWKDCQETLPFQFEPYATEVVLQNILSNAMKYGNHIQIRVEDQPTQMLIEVEDNGQGLEVEKLRSMLTQYTGREVGSTHLGLDVSLYLLNKCGGRLGILSEPGQGTTFSIVLPK